MNNLKLNSDVFVLLHASNKLCKELKLNFTSGLITFFMLALLKESAFHRYLLSRKISDEEILQVAQKLLLKYHKDFFDRERRTTLYYFCFKNLKEKIAISNTLYDIIVNAQEIAQNYYYTETITNQYMLAACIEKFPDIYEEFMSSCLGKEVFLPKAPSYLEKSDLITLPNNLASFLTVMNNEYSSDDTTCKILGREEETEQLVRILAKATKKNAILVGPPGVGKTAIVEKFAWSVVTGNCHEKFKKSKIISLDVTSIIAGTQYRGSAEDRFKDLVEYLKDNPDCILFIDEIHSILGAGACRDGDLDLANSLKPILARGDTQVIGATTLEEYRKYFSQDGALKRRFEKIEVKEPHVEELYDMIKNQISRLEKFHNVIIPRELIDFAILNASCFNYETKNPDRTLDLLDRAMAGAELKNKHVLDKQDILENFAIRKKQFDEMPYNKKMATAYHEAGHYIVHRFSSELQHYTTTLAISIIPAEDYLGVNVYEQNEGTTPYENKTFYIQLIAEKLGGRLAEKAYSGELSSGASSDLKNATKIAKNMVTCYGLDKRFTQNRTYFMEDEKPMYSENVIKKIDASIDKILNEATRYANKILKKHKKELNMLVDELMQKGMLSKIELDSIFKEN